MVVYGRKCYIVSTLEFIIWKKLQLNPWTIRKTKKKKHEKKTISVIIIK